MSGLKNQKKSKKSQEEVQTDDESNMRDFVSIEEDKTLDALLESKVVEEKEKAENLPVKNKDQQFIASDKAKDKENSSQESLAEAYFQKSKRKAADQNNKKGSEYQAQAGEQEDLDSREDDEKSLTDQSKIDFQQLEDVLDSDNEVVSQCQEVKRSMLEDQETKVLERLVKECSANNVCYDCFVGFTSKKSYAQHMKTQHAEDAVDQGLGDFICKI